MQNTINKGILKEKFVTAQMVYSRIEPPPETLRINVFQLTERWPVWLNGRAFARDPKARDPKDRGFESRPVRFQVTALRKLLTRTCLCHQAV